MAEATTAPARLASGTEASTQTAVLPPKVMASTAPSAAPVDTPSVNGVASGLPSSACITTPAAASVAPTIAPVSTRGIRAMKKICASTLSANGIDRSNARARLMWVLPTSGASRQAATASAPYAETIEARRVLSMDALHGHDRQMSGASVELHVRIDVVQLSNRLAGEHVSRCPRREDAAAAHHDELLTHRRREIQVMCREHHRHLPLAIQTGQQRGDFELISEVERCGRFVEQQDLGRLREGAGDDDALFLAAAQRHVAAIAQMCCACRLERLSRDVEVSGPFELKRAEVRMAPHQHHLHHGVIEGGMRLLRHDRDVARQLAARHRPERAVAKPHASTVWTQDAAQPRG